MRPIAILLPVLALAANAFAAPLPEEPNVREEAAPMSKINHRTAPAIKTAIKNLTPIAGRAAPAVNLVVDDPADVVT